MSRLRSLAASIAAALLVLLLPAAASARIYPSWAPASTYAASFRPGFRSLSGDFTFPVGDGTASLRLSYDGKGGLTGGGTVTTSTFLDTFALVGTFSVDPADGVQHVRLAEPVAKKAVPRLTFDGVLAADGGDLVGSMTRQGGFGGLPGTDTSNATLARRNAAKGTDSFLLEMTPVMDTRGRIQGFASAGPASETRATLTVYGRHTINGFELDGLPLVNGKIRGKFTTDRNTLTKGTITIKAFNWSAKLTGPVDSQGFHALCDLKGGGFTLTKIPVDLAVQAGPMPPPGPPPPPPKNQLTGVRATVANGKVTLSHSSVPSKFFGVTAGLTVEFPTSAGLGTIHADPSSASLPGSDARRCIVTLGSTVYGTATAPADVALEVRRLTSQIGGPVEVLATGTVVAANGKKKTVNLLIEATVQ